MKIFEIKTQNGRVYRVVIENNNQLKRLNKKITENKNKEYEKIISIKEICIGINNINQFEKFIDSLQ